MRYRETLEPITVEKTIEALSAMGVSMESVAALFEVSKRTLERRINDDPILKAARIRGKKRSCDDVARVAYEMALSKQHPKMTQFWLQTQMGWGTKGYEAHKAHEETFASDPRSQYEAALVAKIVNMTDEQLEARAAAIENHLKTVELGQVLGHARTKNLSTEELKALERIAEKLRIAETSKSSFRS